MTFLKHILVYDKEQKDLFCNCCSGTGKTKSSRTGGLTIVFNIILAFLFVMSFSKITEGTNLVTNIILMVIIAFLGIFSSIEFKQLEETLKVLIIIWVVVAIFIVYAVAEVYDYRQSVEKENLQTILENSEITCANCWAIYENSMGCKIENRLVFYTE